MGPSSISGETELPEEELLSRMLRALAHPVRIRIVRRLACVGAATQVVLVRDLDASQPNMSQHLRILLWAGFVRSRKKGHHTHYELATDLGPQLLGLVRDFVIQNPSAAGGGTIEHEP